MQASDRDALSEALNSLQTTTAVAVCFRLQAPFAIHKGDVQGIVFRIGEGEPYWLRLEHDAWIRVEPGDIVLMPHGTAHTIASEQNVPAVPVSQLFARRGMEEWIGPKNKPPTSPEIQWGGSGLRSTVVAGILSLRDFGAVPLLRLLPRLIHIRAADSAMTPRLSAALSALLDELNEGNPGWTYAVCRLAELIFCQALCSHLRNDRSGAQGWLSAMADPRIGRALVTIHQDVSREWSVDSLAREVGMSRSRFASRFEELLGETPIRYITQIRLTEAANRLARGDSVVRASDAAGYASEKAFARAFKQWAGVPPAHYRKACNAKRSTLAPTRQNVKGSAASSGSL